MHSICVNLHFSLFKISSRYHLMPSGNSQEGRYSPDSSPGMENTSIFHCNPEPSELMSLEEIFQAHAQTPKGDGQMLTQEVQTGSSGDNHEIGNVILPEIPLSEVDAFCKLLTDGNLNEYLSDNCSKYKGTLSSSVITNRVIEKSEKPILLANGDEQSTQGLPSFSNTFYNNNLLEGNRNTFQPPPTRKDDGLTFEKHPIMNSPLSPCPEFPSDVKNNDIIIHSAYVKDEPSLESQNCVHGSWTPQSSAVTRPSSLQVQNALSTMYSWSGQQNQVHSGVHNGTLPSSMPAYNSLPQISLSEIPAQQYQSLAVTTPVSPSQYPGTIYVKNEPVLIVTVEDSSTLNQGGSLQALSSTVIVNKDVSGQSQTQNIPPSANVGPEIKIEPKSPMCTALPIGSPSATQNCRSPIPQSSTPTSVVQSSTCSGTGNPPLLTLTLPTGNTCVSPTYSPSSSAATSPHARTPTPGVQCVVSPSSPSFSNISQATHVPQYVASPPAGLSPLSPASQGYGSDCSPISPYGPQQSPSYGIPISRSSSRESTQGVVSPIGIKSEHVVHPDGMYTNVTDFQSLGDPLYPHNPNQNGFSFTKLLNDPLFPPVSPIFQSSTSPSTQIPPSSQTWPNMNAIAPSSPGYDVKQIQYQMAHLPTPSGPNHQAKGSQEVTSTVTTTKKENPQRKPNKQIFQCAMCEREFEHSIGLKNHERSHRQDRNHACKYCDEVFHYKTHLKRHERIHAKALHLCRYCGETQGSDYDLVQHERKHRRENHQLKSSGKLSKSGKNKGDSKEEQTSTKK